MSSKLNTIVQALGDARQAKGLSQRALSARVGVPQAHISKIENGMVDVKLSSLQELARALDLELMLVPRYQVQLIKALKQSADKPDSVASPAYQLTEE